MPPPPLPLPSSIGTKVVFYTVANYVEIFYNLYNINKKLENALSRVMNSGVQESGRGLGIR